MHLHVLPQKNLLFFASLRARQYPTVTATSRRGSSARFNVDVGYVIIDVSLLRRRVATRGRGCRPQRVYLQRNKSTHGRNALASTASPNEPITLPLARGHLLLDGQCLKLAHRCGGGVMMMNRGYYHFYYLFLFIFYSLLTPYPPPSLLLSTPTTGRLMIASRATRRF